VCACLRLNFPGCSYVGPGAVENLGREAARLGSKALLVTGRAALRKAGITDRLVSLMGEGGVEVVPFERVPPEPDLATVEEARRMAREEGCDLVVEAGGGSAIDVGKAAAALAGEDAPTAEFHEGRQISRKGLPHIAVATTSGTGSEVTPNSVLTDEGKRVKKSIRGQGVMPDVSISDPELTISCPPQVTAASGMDALAQAIESYLSVYAIPTTEALSLAAVGLIVANLPAAFEDGADLEARTAMTEGSYMAGLALASARLGAVHGLAHPVGLVYNLPHGVVCAVLLPRVLESNIRAAQEKYENLRRVMRGEPVQLIENMLDELDLPHTFGPYPNADDERLIRDYALKSGSSRANPVPVAEDYVRAILHCVCCPQQGPLC